MATYEDEQSCHLPQTEVNTSEDFQPQKEREKGKVVAKIEAMWEDVRQWGKDFRKLSAREQRRFILAASALALGVIIVTGCAPEGIQPGQVNPGDLPKDQTHEVTVTTVVSGVDATPVWTPTVGAGGTGDGGGDEPKIEPTPTVQRFETPTPERPEFIPNSGGPYSEAQWQLIESGTFVDQENQLKAWTEYWGRARNRPFLPGSYDLNYKYLFNLRNPTQAIVLLEATGPDYQGQIFGMPIKDGQFMTTPPSAPEGDFDIPEGFGPLPLSGGDEGLALSNSYQELVRVDGSGVVRELVNMQAAQWEKVPETVEAMRVSVGDKRENWVWWDESIQGWKIRMVYPGEEAISQEPFDLTDASGNVIGKAWSWFTGEYLIGNHTQHLKVPYVWQNYQTGEYSSWIAPLGKNEDWTGWGGKIRESYLTEDQKWVPGQVVELYLNEPITPGVLNNDEKGVRIEAPHFFYVGKEVQLEKLKTEGDPEIGVFLTNISQMVCVDQYQARTMFKCQRPEEMIVVPGY